MKTRVTDDTRAVAESIARETTWRRSTETGTADAEGSLLAARARRTESWIELDGVE